MLFNTVSYVAFLALTAALYWSFPLQWRRGLLLVASIIFYGSWRVDFVFLIAFSAFVDYYFSLKIGRATSTRRRRVYMVTSVSINLALLLYFKYTYFILDNAADFVPLSDGTLGAARSIILPLGISFYTFLSISYTIDVYRRLFDPVCNFSTYLTYVMFWPHMIAGPILRAHELIPQLIERRKWSYANIDIGLRYIIFGLLLKVVLADQIAPLVDDAFTVNFRRLGGLDVVTMAFAFGFQIYFDFAGYSMVAIGSARLLGIRFPENFDWPYLATSPREFWKRWHITLSSWIRDYLYLPLMGRAHKDRSDGGIDIQRGKTGHIAKSLAALYITWFVMGLWHGASWKFAVWGIWHATFIALYRFCEGRFNWVPKWVLIVFGWSFTIVVAMIGWIPFRANSVEHAVGLLARLLDIGSYRSLGFRENTYIVTFVLLIGMLLFAGVAKIARRLTLDSTLRKSGEIVVLALAICLVFIFLRPVNQFIYFQF